MMDFKDRYTPVEYTHFLWLGFKNKNGILIKDDFEGEIRIINDSFFYYKDGKEIKKILIQRDIDYLYYAQKYNKK